MKEQRKAIRVNVDLQCMLTYEGKEYAGHILNIAVGGALVTLDGGGISADEFTEETPGNLQFSTGWGVLVCDCTVSRVSQLNPLTLALEFDKMVGQTKEIFMQMLSHVIRENFAQATHVQNLKENLAGLTYDVGPRVAIISTGLSHLLDLTVRLQEKFNAQALEVEDGVAYFEDTLKTQHLLQETLQNLTQLLSSYLLVAGDQHKNIHRTYLLPEYINDVIRTLQTRVSMTNHTIEVICEKSVSLAGYPSAFSQVLTNLIVNSVSHGFETHNDGKIEIEVTPQPEDRVQIRFSDNGRGIDPAKQTHLFKRFHTSEKPDGGCGMGLNIVGNLIEQTFGGTIECTSELGKGTTFLINIPAVSPHIEVPEAVSLLPIGFPGLIDE